MRKKITISIDEDLDVLARKRAEELCLTYSGYIKKLILKDITGALSSREENLRRITDFEKPDTLESREKQSMRQTHDILPSTTHQHANPA